MEDPAFETPQEQAILFFSKHPNKFIAHSASCSVGTGVSFKH